MATFTYTEVPIDELSSTDLREEGNSAESATAYRITIYNDAGTTARPEGAEALTVGDRTGLAWGADAMWAFSFGDIEQDIDCWLNHNDEWADRN